MALAEPSAASAASTAKPPATPAAAPAAAAAPATRPALGSTDSIALEAVGRNGQWLAYCQPTLDTNGDGKLEVLSGPRGELLGDEPSLFLALGEQALPIDELLSFDRSGRWLVVSRAGQPALVDAETGAMNDLRPFSPDLRADEEYSLHHRALSFDAAGNRLLLLRRRAPLRYEADLFDLSDGFVAERRQTYKLLPGEVWRARLPLEGPLVLFEGVPESSREGATWPAPPAKQPLRRCRGLLTTAGAWNGRGGTVSRTLVDTRGTLPALAPGFVAPFGSGWLRREKNGRLLLVRGATQKQLASAACGARIVHADPSRELLVVACEHYALERPKTDAKPAKGGAKKRGPAKTRFQLYLVGPGYTKELEADTAHTGLDMEPGSTPRLLPLRPGPRSVLVDLDRRRLIELQADDRVVTTHGSKALVRRGAKLSLYDADLDQTTLLADGVRPYAALLVNEPYAFVEPYLVDVGAGRIVSERVGAPLGLTSRGQLILASVAPSAETWGLGPLRLVSPHAASAPPSAAPTAASAPPAPSAPPSQAAPAGAKPAAPRAPTSQRAD